MVQPNKLIRGVGHPVVHWDGIFCGSHGQKASYGASVRLRVSEMNFTPIEDSSVPHRRMLAPNTSLLEQDVSDNESEDGFDYPMIGIDKNAFESSDYDVYIGFIAQESLSTPEKTPEHTT